MIKHLIEFISTNLIAFSSLIISFVTLTITLRNHLETRPNLKVFQINPTASVLIKPDRISSDNPDVYWNTSYRVISEVIMTNESSKPISIIEFRLNNKYAFNGFTKPGESYNVTTKPSKTRTPDGIVFEGVSESIRFPIFEDWLKPILTIPPHTAIRGHLFFNIKSDKDVIVGKNNLTVITSRKTFNIKLEITQELVSQLPPGAQFVQDRYQK